MRGADGVSTICCPTVTSAWTVKRAEMGRSRTSGGIDCGSTQLGTKAMTSIDAVVVPWGPIVNGPRTCSAEPPPTRSVAVSVTERPSALSLVSTRGTMLDVCHDDDDGSGIAGQLIARRGGLTGPRTG